MDEIISKLLLPGSLGIVVGYLTYRFNIYAEYKRRQLDWLTQAYRDLVVSMGAFFAGSDKTKEQKEEVAERILKIYAEAQLLASPSVVRIFGQLLDAMMEGKHPDENARLYKKLVLAMRKQIQGDLLDFRVKERDIRPFTLIK